MLLLLNQWNVIQFMVSFDLKCFYSTSHSLYFYFSYFKGDILNAEIITITASGETPDVLSDPDYVKFLVTAEFISHANCIEVPQYEKLKEGKFLQKQLIAHQLIK